MVGLQNVDNALLFWIRETFCSDFLDGIMMFLTKLGDSGFLWIALGIGMVLLGRGKQRQLRTWGVWLLVCLGITALVTNGILKPMVARTRPYDLLGYAILVEHLSDFSFPSGHTAAAFVGARLFLAMDKKWGIVMTVFACLMGFTRLYLGVHFPSDVLIGGLLGWMITSFVLKGKSYFERKKNH